MKYCRYPVRKPIREKCEPAIKSPFGEIHTAIYLWRGIAWYQGKDRAGLCIDKRTARKYLSKQCLKYGALMGTEYYYEDRLSVFLPFLEMPVLAKRLAEATEGKYCGIEAIAEQAKIQAPGYFE